MKKIVSVLIAVMVIFSVFVINASAEEVTRGYYTYTVDKNGNATITDVDTSISGEIVIPSNLDGYPVTAIGANAFNACDDLIGVTIPNTVESIGYMAFAYLNIEEVILGNNVKTIGGQAFYQSYELSTIHIPASVESIGDIAFGYCGMTNITVDTENKFYSNDEYGVLFNKEKTELIKYTSYNERTSYVIPDTVEVIERFAFLEAYYLTEVTMGDNLTTIGADAFFDCVKMTELKIGKNVSLIGDEAFGGCKSLTNVIIPENVVYFGARAFAYCINLSKVTISEGVSDIGSFAFMYCTALESITIPDSVKSIGEKAFAFCEKLATVNISDDVKNIGTHVFSNTAFYNDTANWVNNALYAGNHLVEANTEIIAGDYTIKTGTITIVKAVFENCAGITSVTIPSTVTEIPEDAFNSCTNLVNIILHDSLTSIGGNAFYDTAYANDEENWENGALYIDEYLIDVKETVSGDFIVKDGTTVISDDAFSGCSKITSITIPASATSIYAVSSCGSLERIVVDEDNQYYSADENGVLFDKNKTVLIKYPSNSTTTEYIVPDSVTEIGDGAFYYCPNLKSLIVSNGVQSVGMLSFLMSDNFEFIHFTSSLQDLGILAFYCMNKDVYICSDTENCSAKIYAEENGYKFKLCDGHGLMKPEEPEIPDKPDVPETPEKPALNPEIIPTPSESKISYGDSIILHADTENVPEGGYVVWTSSNNNFAMSVSEDGTTCKISPQSSGSTTFTATIYDADGNAISTDEQTMTSKAGFFDKIIAFFKKLFGLTKTIAQAYKYKF